MKLHLPESEELLTNSDKLSELSKSLIKFSFFLRKFLLFLFHSNFSTNFPLFPNSRYVIWKQAFTMATGNSEKKFLIDFGNDVI